MEKNKGIERILQIMNYYKLSQRQFALKSNITPQALNNMIVRNHELKLSTAVDILKAFPEVSVEWFIMGEGSMFKSVSELDVDVRFSESGEKARLNEEIDRLLSIIEALSGAKGRSGDGGKVAV